MGRLGRVVFDCNVVLQAAASITSASYACLKVCGEDAGEIVWSDEVLNEYREVLSRPLVRRKMPAIADLAVEAILEFIQKHGSRIDPVPKIVAFARDPEDELYLNLAIAANADLLVSRDNDLLDLGKQPLPPELSLLHRLTILDPVEFLRRYKR